MQVITIISSYSTKNKVSVTTAMPHSLLPTVVSALPLLLAYDIMFISRMTLQPIPGPSGQVKFMQAETTAASEWPAESCDIMNVTSSEGGTKAVAAL